MILAQSVLGLPIILTSCAIMGLVWSYFLLSHRTGNSISNRYLGLLIAALAILLIRQKADNNGYAFFIWLYFVSHGLILLIGPALYLHIKHLVTDNLVKPHSWRHFIVAFIAVIVLTVLFFYRDFIRSLDIYVLKYIGFSVVLLQVIHLIAYVLMARKLVATNASKINKYSSRLERISHIWIKQLSIVSIVFTILILSMYALIISGGYYSINNTADLLFTALLAIIVISIIIRSWRKPEIYAGLPTDTKYKTSSLSSIDLSGIKAELLELIQNDRPHLDPDLTLEQLASQLNIPRHHLSQFINQEYNSSFNHFINGLRLDYAVAEINNGALKSTTLEGIAYDAGFNSKSTFNRAFKRRYGLSPKAYYESQGE